MPIYLQELMVESQGVEMSADWTRQCGYSKMSSNKLHITFSINWNITGFIEICNFIQYSSIKSCPGLSKKDFHYYCRSIYHVLDF